MRYATPARGSGRSTRITVALACTACGARNYRTTRARRDGTPPLALKKFCPACNAHTLHRETK